ncbi:MAG TPA: alpha/beta hydrolase [Stellaceae bacterium]|nr:alpha/beta hydrolase [Stellaceae bacterium]
MSAPVTSKTASCAGIPVAYLESGAGAKTIVFLHGAGGASPEGVSFIPLLGARHRLLLPSRPGFDATPEGNCKSVADVVDVLAAFVREVAGGTAHVVAQSAGGAYGCWLAIRYPDLVESLVLSAPAAFAGHRAPPPPQELARILYGDSPSWAAPPDEANRQRIAKNAQANMRRFPDTADELKGRLGEIKAPTLLLWGTGDRLIPEEALQPYQLAIPTCTRILIHGAAHELPIAACEPWVRLVADFVERGERFVVNLGEGS